MQRSKLESVIWKYVRLETIGGLLSWSDFAFGVFAIVALFLLLLWR